MSFNLNNPNYPNLARAVPNTFGFPIVPSDNNGAYYYSESVYNLASTISTLSTAVAAISLFMFFLAMISGKMIGTEMMAVLQVSFVSLMTIV